MNNIFSELEQLGVPIKTISSRDTECFSMEFSSSNQFEEENDYSYYNTLEYVSSKKEVRLKTKQFACIEEAKKVITGEYINLIREQSYLNKLNNSDVKNTTDEHFIRRLITKIDAVSNYIAIKGYIGPATAILLNPKHVFSFRQYFVDPYKPIDLSKDEIIFTIAGRLAGMTVIIDSRIAEDDIYVFRINDINQPGVVCLWAPSEIKYELNYIFTLLGIYPHLQYTVVNIIE